MISHYGAEWYSPKRVTSLQTPSLYTCFESSDDHWRMKTLPRLSVFLLMVEKCVSVVPHVRESMGEAEEAEEIEATATAADSLSEVSCPRWGNDDEAASDCTTKTAECPEENDYPYVFLLHTGYSFLWGVVKSWWRWWKRLHHVNPSVSPQVTRLRRRRRIAAWCWWQHPIIPVRRRRRVMSRPIHAHRMLMVESSSLSSRENSAPRMMTAKHQSKPMSVSLIMIRVIGYLHLLYGWGRNGENAWSLPRWVWWWGIRVWVWWWGVGVPYLLTCDMSSGSHRN